jgi:transposase InsO family protein
MRTLSQYQVAWNMYQAGSTIDQIKVVVSRDRATVYRWIKGIKLSGIVKFLARKDSSMVRRPQAQTPETTIQKIVDIRNEFGWCGAKIRKELKENHGISLALSTIYRWLHRRFTKAAVGIQRYKKHKALVTADNPREVVEHDTVDLGGGVYAYTAIDIFTKEPSVVIGTNLEMSTGAEAFAHHNAFYGSVVLHQSDGGSEFQTTFREAVEAVAEHRYSRPYKKNEQSHIENFNKSLRSECFPRGEYQQKDVAELQKQADQFTNHYIHRRWHMGLPDMMTPAQFKQYYKEDPETATLELAKVTAKSHLG